MDVLVERAAPLKQIGAALERARFGAGGLVVVQGPAGIGKSGVLTAAGRRASDRGFVVLQARGGELERHVTFGVARQLFEGLLAGLDEPERRAALAGAARLATSAIGMDQPLPPRISPETGPLHGLYWLVANLARRRPMALLVDDAQWADEESLRFLSYLARRVDALPVSVLIGARPAEPGVAQEVLDHLAGEAGQQRLSIGPLSLAGAGTLLASRLGRPVASELTTACYEATGGNPFFLHELA